MRKLTICLAGLFLAVYQAAGYAQGLGNATTAAGAVAGPHSVGSSARSAADVRIPGRDSSRRVGPQLGSGRVSAGAEGGASLSGPRGGVSGSAKVNSHANLRTRARHRDQTPRESSTEPQPQRDINIHVEQQVDHRRSNLLQADLFLSRRLAEIDRLRDVALANGNAELLARADILEQQARFQHEQRVQHLSEAPGQNVQHPSQRPEHFNSRVQHELRGEFGSNEGRAMEANLIGQSESEFDHAFDARRTAADPQAIEGSLRDRSESELRTHRHGDNQQRGIREESLTHELDGQVNGFEETWQYDPSHVQQSTFDGEYKYDAENGVYLDEASRSEQAIRHDFREDRRPRIPGYGNEDNRRLWNDVESSVDADADVTSSTRVQHDRNATRAVDSEVKAEEKAAAKSETSSDPKNSKKSSQKNRNPKRRNVDER